MDFNFPAHFCFLLQDGIAKTSCPLYAVLLWTSEEARNGSLYSNSRTPFYCLFHSEFQKETYIESLIIDYWPMTSGDFPICFPQHVLILYFFCKYACSPLVFGWIINWNVVPRREIKLKYRVDANKISKDIDEIRQSFLMSRNKCLTEWNRKCGKMKTWSLIYWYCTFNNI